MYYLFAWQTQLLLRTNLLAHFHCPCCAQKPADVLKQSVARKKCQTNQRQELTHSENKAAKVRKSAHHYSSHKWHNSSTARVTLEPQANEQQGPKREKVTSRLDEGGKGEQRQTEQSQMTRCPSLLLFPHAHKVVKDPSWDAHHQLIFGKKEKCYSTDAQVVYFFLLLTHPVVLCDDCFSRKRK